MDRTAHLHQGVPNKMTWSLFSLRHVKLLVGLERSSVFMDSTVSESSKAEEIIPAGNSVFDPELDS